MLLGTRCRRLCTDRAATAPTTSARTTLASRNKLRLKPYAAARGPQFEAQVAAHGPGPMNKLLQNFNSAGTSLFFKIAWSDQRLAVPHASIPDIRWVDWAALKATGFKACVFDKDNTLSEPFALEVDHRLVASLAACREVFGDNLALYSNSAGLQQYDPEGVEAQALEAAFGIHVLRHTDKKPAGGCQELQECFGCSASDMVFIGDRLLTDVVFGNRHGMLTVRVAPLTHKGEPPGVLLARRVEEACVGRWVASGVKAPQHPLLPAGAACMAFLRDPAGSGSSQGVGGGSGPAGDPPC